MAEPTPFAPGLTLADGIELQLELSRGVGWTDWAGLSPRQGPVRVRLLDADLSGMFVERPDDVVPFRGVRDPAVARMLRVGQTEGRAWVAYVEPEGALFSRVVAPPPAGRGRLSARHVVEMIGRSSSLLLALRPVSPAGAYAIDDMILCRDGHVALTGLGTARLALAARGAEAWGNLACVAPELREDRWAITEACDVYCLGVAGLALLAGRTPTVEQLPRLLDAVELQHGPGLATAFRALVSDDPHDRPSDPDEIHGIFGLLGARGAGAVFTGQHGAVVTRTGQQAAVESAPAPSRASGPMLVAAAEVRAAAPTPPSSPAVPPRGQHMTEPLDALDVVEEVQRRSSAPTPPTPPPSIDLGLALDLLPSPADGNPDEQSRWVYRKDGRDIGPFPATRIRELLEAGEIDEHTEIVDLFEGGEAQLVDTHYFTDYVIDYLPRRAQAQLARAEKRERVVTEVRRTGRTTIFAGVLAAVALAAVFALTRTRPMPLPLETIYAPWPHAIAAPQPDYQSISADSALLAQLFDFSEPAPPPPPVQARASGSRRSGGAAVDEWQDEVFEEFSVRFDDTAPTRRLTSEEINGTIRGSVGAFRPCFESELRGNPGFRGATVNFSIRPDGGTFNISVDARGGLSTANERCLITAVRRLRFPQFNDVPMSVSFPFNVQ